MLKHRINVKDIQNDTVDLYVNSIELTDTIDDDDIRASVRTVVCSYEKNDEFKNINKVYGVNDYTLLTINNEKLYSDTINKSIIDAYDVSVNNVKGTFGLEVPYLHMLMLQDITYNEEDDYVYFQFKEPHYYTARIQNFRDDVEDEEDTDETLYIWCYTNNVNNPIYLIGKSDEYDESNDFYEKLGEIEIVTDSSFRKKFNKTEDERFFIKDIVEENGTDVIKYNDFLPNVEFYRPNFLFTDVGIISFFFYVNRCCLNVPLSSPQQINLVAEDLLNEYIADARQRSINKVVDMEKDIYYPFIYKGDKDYEPVFQLKFNFHFIFRDKDNENWIAENGNLWNGVEITNDNLELNDDFFSYGDKSSQSDLLSLLNFTNNDVRYQKNKLKKSFIRLSFYDSPNLGNQNLLAYSTIFVDNGNCFAKFVKQIETVGYKHVNCELKDKEPEKVEKDETKEWNDNIFTVTNNVLTGIKVDREPLQRLTLGKTDNEIEELRLSSQIVVTDKYNSDDSSEGFYLYLWRDVLPIEGLIKRGVRTMYMKVEFNHAGYGRVIPFMMPYWDPKKWNGKTGIKTFDEIVDDWSNLTDTDGRYGAKQYSKFSYIKMKIAFDENERKYIYYLDDETYGIVKPIENNTLTFNLYEAKMI